MSSVEQPRVGPDNFLVDRFQPLTSEAQHLPDKRFRVT